MNAPPTAPDFLSPTKSSTSNTQRNQATKHLYIFVLPLLLHLLLTSLSFTLPEVDENQLTFHTILHFSLQWRRIMTAIVEKYKQFRNPSNQRYTQCGFLHKKVYNSSFIWETVIHLHFLKTQLSNFHKTSQAQWNGKPKTIQGRVLEKFPLNSAWELSGKIASACWAEVRVPFSQLFATWVPI